MTTATDVDFLRNRILNVVGHELRTPVSTIRGLADALVESEGREAATILAALRRQAARLEGLVDDLLTATGVTTALPVGPPTTMSLADAVIAAWAAAGGEAGGAVITDPDHATATARRSSVERSLGHVLHNAAAYAVGPTDVLLAPGKVQVEAPGPVLPPEDVEFATEAFWRGERAVMTAPGLGLGLYVARILTEHEGGSLTVEQRPGGGLRTVLQFPV